jgi:hypothetical protein
MDQRLNILRLATSRQSSGLKNLNGVIPFFIICASAFLSITTVIAAPISLTFSTNYILPGGIPETGTGSGTFDTTTGMGSGSITFSQPPSVSIPWIQIPVAIWIVLHFPSKAGGIGPSLLDLSGGALVATMLANMGAAGSALYNISLSGTAATVTADLSSLNNSALPAPLPSFELTSKEMETGAGPGNATGSESLSLTGFGQLATNAMTYQFAGNPTADFGPSRLLTYDVEGMQTGPTSLSFTGSTTNTIVAEPSNVVLLVFWLALVGISRIHKNCVSFTSGTWVRR